MKGDRCQTQTSAERGGSYETTRGENLPLANPRAIPILRSLSYKFYVRKVCTRFSYRGRPLREVRAILLGAVRIAGPVRPCLRATSWLDESGRTCGNIIIIAGPSFPPQIQTCRTNEGRASSLFLSLCTPSS
jgi:hypothetical protein